MIGARLAQAAAAGLSLPEGEVVVFQPSPDADLSLIAQPVIVDPRKPVHDAFAARGVPVDVDAPETAQTVVVCLPRAKAEARALIAKASRLTDGLVIIDGQKTDGVDSMLRAVKARVSVDGTISKAHGKLFWFQADGDAFADWAAGPAVMPDGFWTAPGVFSADGIDPASAHLVAALPDDLGPVVADLGAGWGFLSAHVLSRPDVRALHLVEAHHMALQCAEHNVSDPRATFHWADALTWRPPEPIDTIVMNPPFHTGRAGTPDLGRAFITAAAQALSPRGTLWMVANRHLPYEDTLQSLFRNVIELGDDPRFKLFCAEAPKGKR